MLDITLLHEAKSKFAYLYDKDTIHIKLAATKNKVNSIEVIYGDPFYWGHSIDESNKWEWKKESNSKTLMVKEYETDIYDHFFIALKPEFKRMKYAFIINNQYLFGCRETIDLIKRPELKTNLFNYFNFPYINEEDLFDAPSWIEDQVWYSIFPERFSNGDKTINKENTLEWGSTNNYSNELRFGGDLQGIIDRLDYIKGIGFTGIYMTPIFKADSTHKYDTTDYFNIDEAFGNNEKLGELVEKAHSMGIKVMLDAVFNHCGFRHPYFQDVIKNGKDSKYYDCFYIIDKAKKVIDYPLDKNNMLDRKYAKDFHKNPQLLNYRTFAFTPYMPKLNTNNKLMKKHLFDVAEFWINKYDIDGWRLDVSNEVSHKFWRDFRSHVKTLKSDAYILGENWDNSSPWLQGDQYDSVMNYELLFPIWNYFGTNIDHKQYTSTEFMYRVNKVLTDYPKNVLKGMYNLVDSHDTTRILEICGNNEELVKLPYLFLFTLPGAPSIYYGGEVGLTGKHDPDNRRCMIWNEDKQNNNILNHIQTLIKLRKEYKEFKSTEIRWLVTNDEDEYIIFKKNKMYFIISNSSKELTIKLPKELSNKELKDIYKNEDISLKNSLLLDSYAFYILK